MKMNKSFILAGLLLSATFALQAHAAANVAAGKLAVEKSNCASCHGANFNDPVDPSYPKLAGQHRDYLEHALIAYQRGGDAANGRSNAIMGGQVKALSRQDIRNIAAYLHSLPSSLVLRK